MALRTLLAPAAVLGGEYLRRPHQGATQGTGSELLGNEQQIYITLILRHRAHQGCRRFACATIEQFVQVGLLPERGPRQNNAGERYKLNDESKRYIASDGRVEIHPERCGGDQVDDSNCIPQIFVTHNLLLDHDFLSMPPKIAIHCGGIVN